MKKVICCLAMAIFLYGCSGGQKKADSTKKISINKVWVFKRIDTARSNFKGAWIGDNIIDMSNSDTLRYSAIATHNGATAYPYKVSGGNIYLNGKQTYKIIKLTDSILELSAVGHVKGQSGAAHEPDVVMIYAAK